MRIKSILALILALFMLLTQTIRAQQTQVSGPPPQSLVIGLVDLSAVIAFHPAMRNFDYHAKKFVRPWNGKRYPTAQEAWEANKELIMKVKSVEAKIKKQIELVNTALNEFLHNKIKETEKEQTVETLKNLNKTKIAMLSELVKKTVGMFPETDFADADDQTGNYIMNEIRRAVYDVSLRNNVAFVFNTSQMSISGADSTYLIPPEKESPQSLLDKFEIKNIDDLQKLIFETGKEGKTPFGKPLGKMDFRKGPSGEHFDQIKDPAHVQVLMAEYYQNREIFSNALKKYGASNFLLQGRVGVTEKNLTQEVIQYIFDLHKTKGVVKDAAFKALN